MTCTDCGYPLPTVVPPDQRIRLKPRAELDEHTLAVLASMERTRAEVALWPDWKANECRCPSAKESP